MPVLPSADIFQIFSFNTIRVSNGLDPDQGQHCVGPDLGLNCLQRSSADNKIACRQRVTVNMI